jgi:hypothetical protein
MIDPKSIVREVEAHGQYLRYHFKTLDFLEGNLEPYVIDALRRQLSPKVFLHAVERMVPINILPRYVEKLSNIYQTGVTRTVVGGSEQDIELLGWYEKQMSFNRTMHIGNRLYNACGSCLVHPYITDLGPRLRVIPNDRFIVISDDPIEPTKPTKVILLAGVDNLERKIYWVYTKDEFAVVKSDETIDYAAMAELEVPDGVNPYGVLPFGYFNSSAFRLCPVPDKDTLRITEFVPVALTDLNLAAMFSSFAITYLINGQTENLVKAPNAMWFLRPEDPEKEVTIGTLKPDVDYAEVINLIQTELTLWLDSKGIKAGAIGQLTAESASSGIAKIIDEADTFDVRQEQTVNFGSGERDLWKLILNDMHPVWVAQGRVDNRTLVSPESEVETRFAIVPVGTFRSQIVADQKTEYEAGFTTRTRAISALNPHMTMTQIEELEAEIDEERGLVDVEQVRPSENPFAGGGEEPRSTGGDSGPDSREDSPED